MNFRKKLYVFAIFVLSFANLFADKQIGVIPEYVENESDVFWVGIAEDDVPFFNS